MKTNKLSVFQSSLIGVAGNAPAYGIAIATAALLTASTQASPLAVLICGLAMIGILIAYQKLNEFEVNCGAAYSWVGKIIHPVAGFLSGWSLLVALEFFMVSAMLAAGQAISLLLGFDPSESKLLVFIISLSVLALVSIPALLGASIFGRFQSALTLIELFIVGSIATTALFHFGSEIVAQLPQLMRIDNFLQTKDLSAGIVIAAFFFWGWDVIFNLSEETDDSKKNSAQAGRYTVVILILIYVTFTVISLAVLSEKEITGSDQNVLLAIATKTLQFPYAKFALVAFLISVIGSLDASLIQFSRTLLSQSRDGIFSKRFTFVSPQFGVPTFGITATVAIASILTLISYFSGTVNEIIMAGVTGSAVFVACYYGLAGLACSMFFLRKAHRNKWETMTYVIWPAIASFTLIICALFAALDFGPLTLTLIAFAFIVGIAIAFSYIRKPSQSYEYEK